MYNVQFQEEKFFLLKKIIVFKLEIHFVFQAKRKQGEVELEALLLEGEEKCINKRCVQSEQCCPGSVCVHVDGGIVMTFT